MASSPKNDIPPPGNSRPKSRSPPASSPPPPIEYRYMFEDTKRPTKLLDALLRAIARYIICEIGDKTVGQLTPKKLAAFYKTVGGDYDAIFTQTSHESISFMWARTGCQHTFQPTEDDFAPPSIPALTPRGFSRWESLEILLGPEEHVPFLQYAVRNWNLRHPDTGQPFPPDLPRTCFPTESDAEVDRWHRNCAQQMRTEASREREAAANSGPEPDHPEVKSEPKFAYVRKPYQTRTRGPDAPYFERTERPVPYSHVPGRHAGPGRMPNRPSPERHHQDSRFDESERRRSFSDYNNPPRSEPPSYSRGSSYLDPNATKRPETARRHSQARQDSSDSSDEEPIPPRTARRHDNSPPCAPRYVDPSVPPRSSPPGYRHRPDIRPGDDRRRAAPSPTFREKVSEKFSNALHNGFGPERPRNPNRPPYSNEPRPRRRGDFPPSRPSRSHSDLESDPSSETEGSEDEYQRAKREKDRDRFRESRGRPRDFDRNDERRDRQYLRRPEAGRRTSSHADMDRRREHAQWDSRAREQMREERKRWDKRMPHDERDISPMGSAGRRHPEESYA